MRTFGELESRIMDVVWSAESPLSVQDVADQVDGAPAYTTVITVIERLRAKGWVQRHREGRAFRYQATGSRGQYTAQLMGQLLQDSRDRPGALLSFAGQLDPTDAQALRDALDRAGPDPVRGDDAGLGSTDDRPDE